MRQIVGIGEILWDVFPDGPRFGGAPANFASSAASLAGGTAQVQMVSAVGKDELGRRALDALRDRNVDVAGVQQNDRPTGQVFVEIDDAGVASYRFAENTAWDQLEWRDPLPELAAACDAACFGSLGQRSERSQATIQRFLREMPADSLRILDVNLRGPYYDEPLIRASLGLANVLKLNDDELPQVANWLDIAGTDIEVMRQLADRCELQVVAVTRGADGAAIVSGDQVSDHPGQPVDVVDTVGAGDAFTAALTLGLLQREGLDAINRRAIAAASYICAQQGATASFPPDAHS